GVAGVQVAAGGRHACQHPWVGRHHEGAGAGGGQDQPPAAVALGQGELLGQAATPGDPQQVHAQVSELVQEPGEQPGQSRQPVGEPRQGGASDSGDVEADHLAPGVGGSQQGLARLRAGADAAGQDQRGAGAVAGTDGHPQQLAADGDGAHGPLHGGASAVQGGGGGGGVRG